MIRGKKTKALKILQKTFEELKKNPPQYKNQSQEKTVSFMQTNEKKPLFFFMEAVRLVKPVFFLRKVRVAGTNYQVPAILPPTKQQSMGLRWILEGARHKKQKSPKQKFYMHLAQEIRESFQKDSYANKKKDDLNRQVEANRGVAHYRWW